MNADIQFLEETIQLAKQSVTEGNHPFGALLLGPEGDVLLVSGNTHSTDGGVGHAETNVARAAAKQYDPEFLSQCTLVTSVEPCTMCFGALMHARIARLVYGAREPRAGVCESQLGLPERGFYNHRIEVTGGVCAEEAAQLLRDFFRERR